MNPKERKSPTPSPAAGHDMKTDGAAPPASLLTLLHMLGIQAMVALGEIPNPVDPDKRTDLRQARWLIDTVHVLLQKTRGNATAEETSALTSVIDELEEAYAKKAKTTR
jgi:hypothetical protein